MSFNIRLKALRKEGGMTLEEAAGELGVSITTLSGWEQGYRRPNIESMVKLAHLYQTSSDYILGLTENREPQPISMNAKDVLAQRGLHWDGMPLSDEELRTLRLLLEYVLNDRKEDVGGTREGKASNE
ncbi:helix-turn-helix domain-containing protein [Paenibacillus sp. YYML68]|uniref:helix-turn-helix domain-containing protein n=1 Tax=Paenibacillus sp. YYML68 TaxID=2909250 RepID=UPI00248F822B|nr:helix-turn-helix transcriptional regulator [Paenibacillus sp. YYML68]